MSILVDILSGGSLGALFGGVQRVVERYQETKLKALEFQHVLELHKLQNTQDALMADKDLLKTELQEFGKALTGSYDHDASFKPDTWVDNIRALVRPVLTFTLVWMAWYNTTEFMALASGVVLWWFASSVQLPRRD